MTSNEELKRIEELIEAGKLGDMPDLSTYKNRDEVFDTLINDKEKFSIILGLIAVCVEGRYIRLCGKFAETSIRYKKERKAYLPNIALDILYFLGFIEYLEVSEKLIVAKILDDDLIRGFEMAQKELKNKDFSNKITEYYKNLDSYKEFMEKYSNDNTRTFK